MNQKQREYALGRVKTIHEARLAKLKEAHLIPAITLSNSEKWVLVTHGDVDLKLDFDPDNGYHRSWKEIWDFSAHERKEGYSEEFSGLAEALKLEAERARDQIMLGDTQEALAILHAFEATSSF